MSMIKVNVLVYLILVLRDLDTVTFSVIFVKADQPHQNVGMMNRKYQFAFARVNVNSYVL